MKHSEIKLSELHTVSDCINAIDEIRLESFNFICTDSQWLSSKNLILKKTAQNKLDAIERKMYKLESDVEVVTVEEIEVKTVTVEADVKADVEAIYKDSKLQIALTKHIIQAIPSDVDSLTSSDVVKSLRQHVLADGATMANIRDKLSKFVLDIHSDDADIIKFCVDASEYDGEVSADFESSIVSKWLNNCATVVFDIIYVGRSSYIVKQAYIECKVA